MVPWDATTAQSVRLWECVESVEVLLVFVGFMMGDGWALLVFSRDEMDAVSAPSSLGVVEWLAVCVVLWCSCVFELCAVGSWTRRITSVICL